VQRCQSDTKRLCNDREELHSGCEWSDYALITQR
jgi:hypothetical protein